jgi:hypothetical protein
VDSLHRGGNALQTGARIYAGLRERFEATVLELLVLIEDQVPDLEKSHLSLFAPGAVLRVLGGISPSELLAVVVVDLRAGAART